METTVVLLIVIGVLFAFDCGVIIYLAHTMRDMKKDSENKEGKDDD
jgi:hypothetical protein